METTDSVREIITLNKRDDEKLHKWCDRIAIYIVTQRPSLDVVRKLLQDISSKSFIAGIFTEI